MKVDFERSGGHLPTVLTASVDTDHLPGEDARHLRKLVDDANVEAVAAGAERAMPDAYSYRLSITDDDGGRREIQMPESGVPAPMRPLLHWLTKHARHKGVS